MWYWLTRLLRKEPDMVNLHSETLVDEMTTILEHEVKTEMDRVMEESFKAGFFMGRHMPPIDIVPDEWNEKTAETAWKNWKEAKKEG